MSYCVNCGVELAESEKSCPLCHTEVINPNESWREPKDYPYSEHVNTMLKRIDRGYIATLTGLVFFIPCLITFFIDLVTNGAITWSAYVIGAFILIFVIAFLPQFFKKRRAIVFLAIDLVFLLGYLLFIEKMTDGDWFLGIGLPLALAAGVCVILLTLFFSIKKPAVLVRIGLILIICGLFSVYTELFISIALYNTVRISWSPFALIPCVILGIISLVLYRKRNLKEMVRRRLFY